MTKIILPTKLEIIKILEDTGAGEYASIVRKELPQQFIDLIWNMVTMMRIEMRIRSEISGKIQHDINLFIHSHTDEMFCCNPPFLLPSPYDNLKPNPDFDFVAGDLVCYATSADKELTYAILQYSPKFAAFVLTKYTDATFVHPLEPTEEVSSMDFLFEIELERLVKITQAAPQLADAEMTKNGGGVNYEIEANDGSKIG